MISCISIGESCCSKWLLLTLNAYLLRLLVQCTPIGQS
jgi:hypothetical protein